MGVRVLGDADAAPLLEAALDATTAQAVAVAVDTARYRTTVGPVRAALLTELMGTPDVSTPPVDGPEPGWLRVALAGLDPMARDEQCAK